MKQIYEVTWQDAAYTYEENIPKNSPGILKTIGYLVEETETYINIAVSFKSDSDNVAYCDGFVIPRGVILNITKIH